VEFLDASELQIVKRKQLAFHMVRGEEDPPSLCCSVPWPLGEEKKGAICQESKTEKSVDSLKFSHWLSKFGVMFDHKVHVGKGDMLWRKGFYCIIYK
jgi:hypothetical protein